MSDLISRADAISVLDNFTQTDTLGHTPRQIVEALPSAQPEKRTEERTETHACDCISRQAAIDALDALCQEHRYKIPGKRETYSQYNEAWQDALDRAEGAIFNLPSAQPEIIRCNSCKYWTQSTGEMKGYGLGRCDFHDADLVACNGFCYWAERRTDE